MARAVDTLDVACRAMGIRPPRREVLFAPWTGGRSDCPHRGQVFRCHCGARRRRWRFDLLFDGWLAVEIEGGIFVKGRHVRGQGYLRDMEKYNQAALLGYTVLRYTHDQFQNGTALIEIFDTLRSPPIPKWQKNR